MLERKYQEVKGQIQGKEFHISQYETLAKYGNTKEIKAWLDNYSHAKTSTKEEAAFKRIAKDISTVTIPTMEYGVTEEIARDGNKTKKLKVAYDVQIMQESTLVRRVENKLNLLNSALASDNMLGNSRSVIELLGINIDGSIVESEEGTEEKTLLSDIELALNKGIHICYNRNNGRFRNVEDHIVTTFNEFTVKYEFIGVTNSGLRKGTLTFAATEVRDGGDVKNIDDRLDVLRSTLGQGLMKMMFNADGSYKCLSGEQLFKILSRMMLGSPASKVIAKADNMIVFDKIGEKTFSVDKDGNVVNTPDAFDGTSFVSELAIRKYGAFPGISRKALLKKTFQIRAENAGLKCSGIVKSDSFMKGLAEELIGKGNVVKYVVHNGQRVETKDLTDEIKEDLLSNLDYITDTNALKIETYEGLELTMLKQAYASASKLNTVTNLQMMNVDPIETIKLIEKKVKEDIINKLRGLGLDPELSGNGSINNIDIAKEMNGTGQFTSSLMSMDVEKMMQLFPGAVKSLFNTTTKSIINVIDKLNPHVESVYLAVIPDLAVLFGERILKFSTDGAKEVYSASLTDNVKTSAARHPISGLCATTTFNSLSMGAIARRIAMSNMTEKQKELVMEFYRFQEGYATIPASEYLKQKHDGMDFDIDAMVFILDKDCVEILAKVIECGTVIDENDPLRKQNTDCEKSIKAFHKKAGEYTIVRHVENKAVLGINQTRRTSQYSNLMGRSKDLKEPTFANFLKTAFKQFRSSIDPVGKITNAFYNNALLAQTLKDPKVSKETKENIARAFREYYGIDPALNKKVYERKLNEKDGEMNLDKKLCMDIICDFQDSCGNVESVLNFLSDCCNANRYPGETSIDAVKNMFQVVNYFDHSKCLLAMGSEKAITVKPKDFDDYALYAEAITGTESDNYFGISKLEYSTTKNGGVIVNVNSVGDCKIKAYIREKGYKSAGIEDSFFELKKRLIDFANDTLVFAAEFIKSRITSEEADKYRMEILARGSERDCADSYRNANKTCRSLKSIITTTYSTFKEKKDVDGMDARLYLKLIAESKLVNTKDLAFKSGKVKMSDEEIGLAFVYSCLARLNVQDEPGFIHSKAMEIFGKEIMAFLRSEGVDTRLKSRVLQATKDGQDIPSKQLEDVSVTATNGVIVLENGTKLVLRDKKLNAEGCLVNGEFVYELETKEGDPTLGIYVSGEANKDFISIQECANNFMNRGTVKILKKETELKVSKYRYSAGGKVAGSFATEKLEKNTVLLSVFSQKVNKVVYFNAGICRNTISLPIANLIDEATEIQPSMHIYRDKKAGEDRGMIVLSCVSQKIEDALYDTMVTNVTSMSSSVGEEPMLDDDIIDMLAAMTTEENPNEVKEDNSLFPGMETVDGLDSFVK